MSASARAPVGAGSIKHPAAGHGGGREAGQGPHRKAIGWPPANPGWATKPRASPRLCDRHCPSPWTIAVVRRRLASLRENTLAHRGERDATFLPMPPKRRSKPRQALPQRVAVPITPALLTRGPDQADQARGNPGLAHLCKSHGIRRLGRLRRAKLARFLHRGASDLWVPARLTLRAVEMSADVACPLS